MNKNRLAMVFILMSQSALGATYDFIDGGVYHQDFIINSGEPYHYINLNNGTTLKTDIQLNSSNTTIDVKNNSIIDAIIHYSVKDAASALRLTDTKQNNKFVLNIEAEMEYSGSTVINPYYLSIQSSDAQFDVRSKGRYIETLAGAANNPGTPSNPNIIKLKHDFYGDGRAQVRWVDSEITGNIVLSDNAYAYYDAYLRTSFQGAMTLNDAAKLDFVFMAASNGGRSASIVNANIDVNDNATANIWFGDEHYGYMTSQAVLNGNMLVSDRAKGNVFTGSWGGVWNGDLITRDNATGQYLIQRDDNPRANWNRWTGDAIANDESMINVTLQQGTTWMGKANQSDNAAIEVSLNDASSGRVGSRWIMTGNSTVHSLSSNHGQVYLSPNATDFSQFNTLTTDNLVGTGVLIFKTDIATHSGDKLVVNNKIESGNQFSIDVNNQAGAYTKAYQDLMLVRTYQSENDAFALTHNVEVGGYEYLLVKKGEDWYLSTADYKPTTTLKSAVGSAYTAYLLDMVNKDVLIQRQGDLRSHQETGEQAWVKQTGGRIRHVNQDIGLLDNVQMSYYGFQMGADKQLEDSNSFIGLTTGYIAASQHYGADNKGSGSTDGFNIGAYFTSLYDNSTYLNVIARYSYYNNDFTAIDTADDSIKGDTSTKTLSASIEVGYKHEFENVYLAPFAQLTLTRFSSYSLTASNDLTVNIGHYHSLLSKIGLNVGVTHFDTKNTQLYFKTAVTKEFLANVSVIANDRHDKSTFKEYWMSSGFGMTSEFAKNHHLYSDVEFTYGGKFKNTQVNIGYLYHF